MFRDLNVLRLIPDRPGRGGAKFGYHSFQQEPINDTRETLNVNVWQDSWRIDKASTSIITGVTFNDELFKGTNFASCLALHGYSKFSLTSPSAGPTTSVLGHNIANLNAVDTGYIFDYSGYSYYFVDGGNVSSSNIVCYASYTHPAVFCNIGNRCFIGTGEDEGKIYDRATGPEDAFLGGVLPQVYTIGVGAPAAAPVVGASDVASFADIYLRTNSKYISYPDVESALFTAVAPGSDTLIIKGDGRTWDGANAVDLAAKTTTFSSAGWTVSIDNGSNIATFAPVPAGDPWVGLRLTVSGEEFTMMAFGVNPVAGDPALTTAQCLLSRFYKKGKLPEEPGGVDGGWDPADNIVNQTFTITGVRWELRRLLAPVLWPGGFTTGDPTIVGELVNTGGRLTWADTPPSYAYAWYDPQTGHISNISPVFSPEATSVSDVGIQVNVDVGSISYPPSTSSIPRYFLSDRPSRWTHILFFRTLMAGGSTLYPIGSLNPYVTDDSGVQTPNPDWKGLPNQVVTSIPPSGTGNYWYDSARDADLLISGALRAPQFTNNKPRIIQNGVETILYPAHMAYWDGRLWIAGTQDPAALHYSCDRVQCPFGIPEESFPDTNVLRIPASDGCIRGMKLIGENLLLTTERWAYTVAGNNESNYRLVRVSTRMAGVGDYQMDEFVSDVEGGGALVVFVGTDAKVYAMPLGGNAVVISKEIQTYLDAANLSARINYRLVRVHCMTVGGQRLVLVFVPNASRTSGKTFVYNFDLKVWTEHTIQNDAVNTNSGLNTAWATITTQDDNVAEIYTTPTPDVIVPIVGYPFVKVRRWQYSALTSYMDGAYIRTFPLTFDGKKTRKQLHFVRVYVNKGTFSGIPGILPWRCIVNTDSGVIGIGADFVGELDTAYTMVGVNSVDSNPLYPLPGASEYVIAAPSMTGGPPLLGYSFDVKIQFPEAMDRDYRLFALDIGWSTVSDGQLDP